MLALAAEIGRGGPFESEPSGQECGCEKHGDEEKEEEKAVAALRRVAYIRLVWRREFRLRETGKTSPQKALLLVNEARVCFKVVNIAIPGDCNGVICSVLLEN